MGIMAPLSLATSFRAQDFLLHGQSRLRDTGMAGIHQQVGNPQKP